ncbi:MAG: DUF6427 family protein [Crocinitomicaceae bacterium]|nr:DUF6427 family protein [Crocinitomicaceae bacterium]
MVKLFFGNRSFALLFLPVIIGLFGVLNFFFQHHNVQEQLTFGFWGNMHNQAHWLYQVSAFVLILINAIMINNIFNRNDFMDRNNYLASLLYVVLMSFFHSFYFISGAALAQTLLVLVVVQLFKLNQNEDGRKAVFNSALLFGLAASFYPVLLIGTPFLFWMIWVMRPFILRESLLAFTGFLIPLVYAGVYGMFAGIKVIREDFSSSAVEWNYYDFIVLVFLVSLLVIASISEVVGKIGTSSIRSKKLFRMILLLIAFLMTIAVIEFLVFDKIEGLGLLIFPFMFIIPYAFGIKTPRTFAIIMYYLIFLFAVGKFFIPFDSLGF